MIDIIQKATRTKKIVGYDGRRVVPIGLTCLRKPLTPQQMASIGKSFFCFTSNYTFAGAASYIKPLFWLHCHRDPSLFNNAPTYLMSESDFLDPRFFPSNKVRDKNFDYIYFTGNDFPSAYNYKGFDIFLQILPLLNQMKLKGCMLVYVNGNSDWKMPLSKQDRMLLQTSGLNIVRQNLDHKRLAALIAKCRFAIFPNKSDCSPRMIPECFLNNVPVLMNQNILGGWKYIAENPMFGQFFDPANLSTARDSIEKVMSLPSCQHDQWMSSYGFMRSAKRLADIIKMHADIPSNITHSYFDEFSSVFHS